VRHAGLGPGRWVAWMGTTGVAVAILAVGVASQSLPGEVVGHLRIGESEGGFVGALDDFDNFAHGVAWLSDLDGDGTVEVAVGVPGDDDGGEDRGAVWILSLDPDGTVAGQAKISATSGRFSGPLDDGDRFGTSLALLGDLDRDGRPELAVGAMDDDDGGIDRGAVWILSLEADLSVAAQAKISASEGGNPPPLVDSNEFGTSLAAIGDHDGDGVSDLAVGMPRDVDGAPFAGSIWILFLDEQAAVKGFRKISATQEGFTGDLDAGDRFGTSVASLGDLDGDGVGDVAVGAPLDADGGGSSAPDRGAVWILFLHADGTVKAHQKISDTEGGFQGVLFLNTELGASLAFLGDLDGDGAGDLAVGSNRDGLDFESHGAGAVWILFLRPDGRVRTFEKLGSDQGGLDAPISLGDRFAVSAAAIGDLDANGVVDLLVGADQDHVDGPIRGVAYVLFLTDEYTPWLDLGQGLAGTQGLPGLTGSGVLHDGETVTLSLENGVPSGLSFLFLGLDRLEAPLKQGVLVPSPDVLLSALPLDATGALELGFPWPPGLRGGIKLYYQHWISDPGGPAGFAASNGLLSPSPPRP